MKLIGTIRLETERLILRRLEVSDYKKAYDNWYSNKNVSKYSLWEEHKSNELTKKLFEIWYKEYQNLDVYRWIIELKDTKEVIGIIDSQSNKYEDYGAFELGFSLSEKYWNQDYMTETVKRIIKFFIEDVEANVVYAECISDNKASEKVMIKSGMKKEGILKSRVNLNNKINDIVSYSITKEMYYNDSIE